MDVENGEALGPDDIADIHREADEDIRSKMKLAVNTRLVIFKYNIIMSYNIAFILY